MTLRGLCDYNARAEELFSREVDGAQEVREVRLDADLVVLATGMLPAPEFYEVCLREQVAPEVHLIGDALAPATVAEAVKAGGRYWQSAVRGASGSGRPSLRRGRQAFKGLAHGRVKRVALPVLASMSTDHDG